MLIRSLMTATLAVGLAGVAGAQSGSSANAALGVEVSRAIGGRLVTCPAKLNVTAQAVCLYVPGTLDANKAKVKARLGARAIGDWKTSGKTASLVVREGNVGSYVLLAQLGASELLVIVDSPKAARGALSSQVKTAPATTRPATTPTSAGATFVNVADLRGLVTATPQTGGVVQLTRAGGLLIVTPGSTSARTASGAVTLTSAPFQGGAGLLLPVDALKLLGCTVTNATAGTANVTCGSSKATVKLAVR
ncbi:hypothetical protein [Deinococcus maricopensis]|nr:hypothetical protein [Deinococcus maricopensis]